LICGLSANDLGSSFLAAGADTFWLKPFPAKADEVQSALADILRTWRKSNGADCTARTSDSDASGEV